MPGSPSTLELSFTRAPSPANGMILLLSIAQTKRQRSSDSAPSVVDPGSKPGLTDSKTRALLMVPSCFQPCVFRIRLVLLENFGSEKNNTL